jgi:hypothetical protein
VLVTASLGLFSEAASELDTIADIVSVAPHADEAFLFQNPQHLGTGHGCGPAVRNADIVGFVVPFALHDSSFDCPHVNDECS